MPKHKHEQTATQREYVHPKQTFFWSKFSIDIAAENTWQNFSSVWANGVLNDAALKIFDLEIEQIVSKAGYRKTCRKNNEVYSQNPVLTNFT